MYFNVEISILSEIWRTACYIQDFTPITFDVQIIESEKYITLRWTALLVIQLPGYTIRNYLILYC